LSRAERIAFLLTLLGTPQEVSKKGAKTFPLGTPLAADAGLPRRGCLCGQRSGKDFCHPVLFEIFANRRASQMAKIFASLLACTLRVGVFSSKRQRKI
jgi:hypothetical protein